MSKLPHMLKPSTQPAYTRPIIFDASKPKQRSSLERLLKGSDNIHVKDFFEAQLKELFLTHHPKLKLTPKLVNAQFAEFRKSYMQKGPLREQGRWVYFSWNNILVHLLEKRSFFELRTSRNHDLITKEEQDRFRNSKIGIAGLSVGNSVAFCLALEGVEHMRLADFDELSLPNLNRIRASVSQLGLNKTTITAQQIYELNPYAKLKLYRRGIATEAELKKFIAGPPSLDIMVDEMDDVIMKVKLRLIARKLRIPVVSAADNGDNAIVDIERFDLEPKREIFHGRIGKIDEEKLMRMDFAEKLRVINGMVGVEYVTSRMKKSLLQVGTTLYAWPQLGGAAFLSGAAVTYVIQKIALGEKIPSGKYDVNLDRVFTPQYDSRESRRKREKETLEFLNKQK